MIPGKLTYRRKTYLLLSGFVLFLLLGYRFSFADTFRLASSIQDKETKIKWLREKEKELPSLQKKVREFDLACVGNDSLSVRDQLTAHISAFAEEHDCLVTEIPTNSEYRRENLRVKTNTFTLKGNFADLSTLLYKLETDYRYLSKVVSARYYTVHDHQSRRKYLYLTIITQSFEQAGN